METINFLSISDGYRDYYHTLKHHTKALCSMCKWKAEKKSWTGHTHFKKIYEVLPTLSIFLSLGKNLSLWFSVVSQDAGWSPWKETLLDFSAVWDERINPGLVWLWRWCLKADHVSTRYRHSPWLLYTQWSPSNDDCASEHSVGSLDGSLLLLFAV